MNRRSFLKGLLIGVGAATLPLTVSFADNPDYWFVINGKDIDGNPVREVIPIYRSSTSTTQADFVTITSIQVTNEA